MVASSSFTELKASNPPSRHSPLCPIKMDDSRTLPCTDDASSFTKERVFCLMLLEDDGAYDLLHTAILYSPHLDVSSLRLFRRAGHCKGVTRSVAT